VDKKHKEDIGALIRLLAYAMLEAERLGLKEIAKEIDYTLAIIPEYDEVLHAQELS
jgi:hypothetical protein